VEGNGLAGRPGFQEGGLRAPTQETLNHVRCVSLVGIGRRAVSNVRSSAETRLDPIGSYKRVSQATREFNRREHARGHLQSG
jgi:hypothetical protein